MATLLGRKGDTQALKCLISAAISNSQLLFSPLPSKEAVRSKASNPFGTNAIALLSPNGSFLTEANVISKLLGKDR